MPGDIILHMCTINENHMMYAVPETWSMTDIIFSPFGPFCALVDPQTTRKIIILKKYKKLLEIPFYVSVP